MIGVALGVAVVCFVMSMHNGFENEIRMRLLGTTAHITVFPKNGYTIADYNDVIERVESVEDVVAASPFIYYKAAISSEYVGDGIVVRGIDLEKESRTALIADDIIAGSYNFEIEPLDSTENAAGMFIGASLANRLGVTVGDPVLLYSLRGENIRRATKPRVARFYITGIFETGLYEFDSEMAYIPLEAAQRLFRMGDEVTGVHMRLTDIFLAEELVPELEIVLGPEFMVMPWYELHENLFAWLAIEKKVLFIGFILIVLVAAFSIISTLVMLAMEKRSDIGILKTIGATTASIKRIFLLNGLIIGLVGIIAGWSIALAAAWVQNRFNLITIPGDLYFIDYLPIRVDYFDYILVGILTVIICLVAAWYPARRASRQSVISVIRQ
jgi:lipoprotein-releasing system permease protein